MNEAFATSSPKEKSPEETRKMLEEMAREMGATKEGKLDAGSFDSSDLEKFKERFEEQFGDVEGQLKKLQESGETLPGGVDPNQILQILNSGKKSQEEVSPEQKKAMQKATLEMMGKALGQYRKKSQQEVENDLLESTKSNKIAYSLMEKNPKLRRFIAAELRHEKALMELFSIVFTRPLFYYYSACMLATVVLGWIIKSRARKARKGFVEGLSSSIKRMIFIFCLRLGITLGFWHKQLAPTFEVFKDSFFS